MLKKIVFSCLLIFDFFSAKSQCCLVYNDSINNPNILNTFYPVAANLALTTGATSIDLQSVPQVDQFGNSYGDTPISPGDVVLIIQMQGVTFNAANSNQYGANTTNAGPDNLGGTGSLNSSNIGIYEFVIAQNSVPLTGGTLQINGTCSNGGIIHNYFNADATALNGQARFQVVRIPRFEQLTLQQNITTTAWNGTVGGIVAFFVQGNLNLNGYQISADGKGFRGGYQEVRPSGNNVTTYATTDIMLSSGKGEGICGTPRFLWNGQNQVDNGASWLGYPGGNYGRGAPGNAGGGGNTHNAGGGGGGGCGSGGVAGNGIAGSGTAAWPNGGRPGSGYNFSFGQLIFGGGGGGGDANNAQSGVKGGAGGGIVFIKAGEISGIGTISASGTNGQVGVYGAAPDGAGGGGGGGNIVIFSDAPNNAASLNLIAKGGNGGNTLNDANDPHGPGGGGGGGKVYYNIAGATIINQIANGNTGLTNNGNGSSHGGQNGQPGQAITINPTIFYQNLPPAINPKPEANFLVTDICINEPYTFTNTSTAPSSGGNMIVANTWNFGDGGTSSDQNPQHTFTSTGVFNVILIVETIFGCTDTISQNVTIYSPVNINENISICESYIWPANNSTYTQSGIYNANFSTIHGCDSTHVLNLTIHPSFITPLQETICSDEVYVVGNSNFNQTGNYTVILQSVEGCDSTIELSLIVNPMPESPELYASYIKCPGEPFTLSADSIIGATINWNGPANFESSQFSNTFLLESEMIGNYSASITILNCTSQPSQLAVDIAYNQSYSDFEIPNVITPNGDLNNDEWNLPELAKTCEEFELIILNRWGNNIFKMSPSNPIFKGKDFNDNYLEEGVYFYKLQNSNTQKHGFFHVIY